MVDGICAFARVSFFKPSGFDRRIAISNIYRALRSALLHIQAPVALRKVPAVTLRRELARNRARIREKRDFCDWRREQSYARAKCCAALPSLAKLLCSASRTRNHGQFAGNRAVHAVSGIGAARR